MDFKNEILRITAENTAYGIKTIIEDKPDLSFDELLNTFAVIALGLGYPINLIDEFLLQPNYYKEKHTEEYTIELNDNHEKEVNNLKRTLDQYEKLLSSKADLIKEINEYINR